MNVLHLVTTQFPKCNHVSCWREWFTGWQGFGL